MLSALVLVGGGLYAGHRLESVWGLPPAVGGMVIVAALCLVRPQMAARAEPATNRLIGWMGLFFVPALVTVAQSWSVLGERWWTTVAALILSTPVGVVVSVTVYRSLQRLSGSGAGRGDPAVAGGPGGTGTRP
ncbi:MAG TPA: CidA/LrgA family protein [Acidimicrobiales bacterium]